MHKKHLQVLASVTMALGLSLVATTTIPAKAKTTYTVTKTTKLTKTPYYVTNQKKVTYAWNLAHTKKLQIVSGGTDATTYFADKQVTLKHDNKKTIYYHINNENGNSIGYVYRGTLTKGYAPDYSDNINDGKYYRLNVATKVTTNKKSFILPKDTIVRAATNINHQKETLSVSLINLSYNLKKQLGISINDPSASAGASSKLDWTKISTPTYMLPNTNVEMSETWNNDLFPGSDESKTNKQRLRITTDGFVEFYNNSSYQSIGTSYPVGAPTSRRILTSKTNGTTFTITYDQAIPGLPDTAVTVDGKTEYQLTIQKQKQLTDKDGYALAHYLVGGKAFYSWASGLLLPSKPIPAVETFSAAKFKKLDKEFFNTDSFYKTKKKIKAKVAFTGYDGGFEQLKTVTIPKGTIVEGDKPNRYKLNGKWTSVVTLRTNVLSSRVLKPGYQTGLVASSYNNGNAQQVTPASALQKIKRPKYLVNYNYGAFYSGSSTAINNRLTKLSPRSIQVTSDGYVEVRKNTTNANSASYYRQPDSSVKIQRVTVKGQTRQLFLSKSIKGLKTVKVTYHGKTQYRLTMTNQRQYRVAQPFDDSDDGPSFYMLYTIAGKAYYTPLGSVNG